MAKKPIIDLKPMNLSYKDRDQTIKLLTFKKSNMTLDIAIYENEKFIKNSNIVFAHLPKSIKSKIKPL
ncbi:malate dehydrogenase [Campylobacterota bacterium DY0563]|uniref:malate dehydrogenase n=1 Tax=Halarcobacter sp. TaxID=2321133 RepID=UPI0029F48887|nr:malate dehydrogenase [Halarcobacter sp.]